MPDVLQQWGSGGGPSLAAFLADAAGRVGPETLRGYTKFLAPFRTAYAALPAESLTAAQAAEADGWLRPSDTGAQLSALAGAVREAEAGHVNLPPSSELKRLMWTWSHLTVRQRQVLALLGCGIDNRRLAEALELSERAVKMHVSALLDKFKADSRAELAVIACRAGLHGPKGFDSFRT